MKKLLTLLLTLFIATPLMLFATPTEKPTRISFLTKASVVTACCGSTLLYAAFSQLYKNECLAKDEVMENNEFKRFVLNIIKGIFSFDLDEREKYHEKYPKITTLLVITAASYGLAGLLSCNDFCNWVVSNPEPKMCTMETQCSLEIIEADRVKIVAGGVDETLSSFQGTKRGMSMEEMKLLCPAREVLDLSKEPATH